ncbi:unnamed protein product [Staurois parvus]|uniref:Uncharacterized protein n=1 Tax=Staurois parvus TaxID=386267 RepID=A0ABN9ASK2_9NEOB|nr:unnamed protein product [Staurois parvus]
MCAYRVLKEHTWTIPTESLNVQNVQNVILELGCWKKRNVHILQTQCVIANLVITVQVKIVHVIYADHRGSVPLGNMLKYREPQKQIMSVKTAPLVTSVLRIWQSPAKHGLSAVNWIKCNPCREHSIRILFVWIGGVILLLSPLVYFTFSHNTVDFIFKRWH